MMFHTD